MVSPTIITLTCGQDVIVDNLVGVISLTIECIVYNGSEPFTFQVLKDGELIGNNFMLSFTPPTDNNFGTYTFTLSTEHCGNVTAVSRIIHQGQFLRFTFKVVVYQIAISYTYICMHMSDSINYHDIHTCIYVPYL